VTARIPARFSVGAPVLLASALLLAGCAWAPPTVEFGSAAGTVQAGPAQYCDVAVTKCENRPEALVRLVVPAGQPLRITVPDDVAASPWHVVFAYRGDDGGQVDGRSPVFAPNQRRDYTLMLPTPTDQLLTAQVQEFGGGAPTTGPDGEVSFPIRGSWVLSTS
jgi:hypothetical protein